MIVSFRDADTEALAGGRGRRRFANIATLARRKLRQLEIAGRLDDLRVPPGNRPRPSRAIAPASTASASTISTASVSAGHQPARRTSRSSTITKPSPPMTALKPVTPGELLLEEFLVPMRLSQYRLAKELGVPAQRLGEIIAGRRAITADTDLRFCRFFGLSNGYWLRAQAAYDTEVAAKALAPVLRRSKPWAGSAA
jgi:addiction module HigA family antidote